MVAAADMRLSTTFNFAKALSLFALTVFFASNLVAQQPVTSQKATVFHIKYISESSVYLDSGRNADLQEGMKLSVIEATPDGVANDGVRFRGYPHVAELKIVSVADSSAVCDVLSTNAELKIGQFAFLTPGSVEDRHLAQTAQEAQNYPVVVAFTDGDPIDQELRASKVEQINESPLGVMRGRFGFSYGGINESGLNSSQLGMMIETDMTHIGGSYWNFAGYWRGTLTTSSSAITNTNTTTLTDLINRTYTLGFTYQNPYSPLTVGVGRLYLPWAPSLSTIDGGYFGRRLGRFITVGAFAGSTPNPTSWSYNPDQQIAGTFVNFESGDYDHLHFMSTEGIALTTISLRVARQFAFLENNLSWKRYLAFYNSMQVDAARTSPLPDGGSNPTGISQSYTSFHVQPWRRVGFGINHNFYRQLPTFDPLLVGTGLLDKYLFQGFSGDVRVDLPAHVSVYASLGHSKATSDSSSSLNQAYGITLGNIAHTGLLLDAHYSKFNSSFGSGEYESVSISKSLSEKFRLQLIGGNQQFNSPFSTNTSAKFVNGVVDWNLGSRYFLEGNVGLYNGTTLNYTQWSTLLGYRFGGLRR
jgi:hypothetical protein